MILRSAYLHHNDERYAGKLSPTQPVRAAARWHVASGTFNLEVIDLDAGVAGVARYPPAAALPRAANFIVIAVNDALITGRDRALPRSALSAHAQERFRAHLSTLCKGRFVFIA